MHVFHALAHGSPGLFAAPARRNRSFRAIMSSSAAGVHRWLPLATTEFRILPIHDRSAPARPP